MKKIVFNIGLTLCIMLSCSKDIEQPTPAPVIPPTISTFSPTTGTSGTEITINGKNFTGVTAVSFGGVGAASFSVVNSTIITATVSTGSSGEVKIVTASGTATLAGFTYTTPIPAINIKSFSPMSGSAGAQVTIIGKSFTGLTAVSFGGTAAASFNVANDTTVIATVGTGASGDVKVVGPSGMASLAGFTYSILPPTISSVSQNTGTTNSSIIITGTNLTGATAVSFGGTAASSFSVVNATSISAVIGTGNSGDIVVTTPGGNATFSGFKYTDPIVTACKIPDAVNQAIAIGFSKRLNRTSSIGTVKVGVIFVDFSDAVATKTPKELFDQFISSHAEEFLKTVSYNNITVQFEPTFQWFRMSKTASNYNITVVNGHSNYIKEAISVADAKVDFSKFNHVLVVSDPANSPLANGPTYIGSPGNGLSVDGIVLSNAITSGRDMVAWPKGLWFCHEFGHSMGLIDFYSYSGAMAHRYVGDYSIMGKISGVSPEYLGWERWILGWINDNQVVCQGNVGNGSVTLTAIEIKGGIKLLTIPIDANSILVVECRRKLGYDKSLSKEGPLVYLVDTKLGSGNGAVKVLPMDDADESKLQAPLSISQTLTYKNISITYKSKSNDGDLIAFEKK